MIVWAIESLAASSLLMLLVLAIRRPVRRMFGPNIAYALWAMPALRMLLPPLPERFHATAAPIAEAGQAMVYYIAEPFGVAPEAAGLTASASSPAIWPWVLAAWILGSIGFIAYHLIAHRRFCRRIRRGARSVRTVANGNVRVIETAAATGPLAFGIWRKYVAFPRDFAERYDALERDLALAHELGHHARGDLIANWAALVVLALHWFNPIAWRAFRAFRADQEMACDALVLSGRAPRLRHAYGRAIVKSAHGGAVSAACHLHTVNELKGRLRMLNLHERTSRSRLIAGGTGLAVLAVAGLGLTASGTQAAERVRTRVETAVGVDLSALSLPAFQAAPAAPLPPPPGYGPTPPTAVTASTAPIAPTAPSIREETTTDADGTVHKRRYAVMVRDRDGKLAVAHAEDVADMPTISTMRITRRDKDGKLVTQDFADMPELALLEALKHMPDIRSRNCGSGEGDRKEFVIDSRDGDKRRMIICVNRIERHASDTAASAEAAAGASAEARVRAIDAEAIERNANASALEGLRNARRSVMAADMTEARRAAALQGIDEAIAEMESKRGR